MGLPYSDRYRFTSHAIQRYQERIDEHAVPTDILKDFRSMTLKLEYLSKEPDHNEAWIHRERGVVFILNPRQYQVITLYHPTSEFDKVKEEEKEEVPAGPPLVSLLTHLHPTTQSLLADFAIEKETSQLKHYYSQLAPLYKELSERLYNLSRTKHPEYFTRGQEELTTLTTTIASLEDERDRVIQDLHALHTP